MKRRPRFSISELLVESLRSYALHTIATQSLRSGRWKDKVRNEVDEGRPAWRILRYGRIVDLETFHQPLIREPFVKPETFGLHMRTLADHCAVISLSELLSRFSRAERITEPTVVITLDGGRPEHASEALPILRDLKRPAAFFLPTAFVGSQNAFWEDKIVCGLMLIAQHNLSFNALQSIPDEFKTDVLQLRGADRQITLERALLVLEYVDSLSPDARLPVFEELGNAVESVGGLMLPPQFLSWEDVGALTAAGMEIGSLTHQRLRMAECSHGVIRADLTASYAALHAHGVSPSPLLALPDGILLDEPARTLMTLDINVTLGSDAPFSFPVEGVTVLPRLTMNQYNSHTPGRLMSELWPIAPRFLRRW